VRIIDSLLENDVYEKRKAELEKCKDLVLEEYNMFNYLASCLDRLDPNAPKKSVTIKPANSMHSIHNVYIYVVKRNLFKFKRSILRLFKGKSVLDK
jgi:hypothetical protein